MKITFPNKIAQEIVKDCNNKLGNSKLLWSTWIESEDFYTKEKCRPRTIEVSDEIEHYDKNWNECKELVGEDNMLNFAETLWFLLEYWKQKGEYPKDALKWSWTSSRSSLGYLVFVGYADADGVVVGHGRPVYSGSSLGVRFFRSAAIPGAKPEQGEADSLDVMIQKIKKAGYQVSKIM